MPDSMSSLIRSAMVAFNRSRIWRRRVSVGKDSFTAASFDRLLYLGMRKTFHSDTDESRFLASCLKPGMHVVDVGANLGIYSHILARAVGSSGRVTAFEPDPDVYASLSENIRINGLTQIVAHRIALGAKSGTASFQRSSHNYGENRLTVATPDGASVVETPVIMLDEFLEGAPVDFIKMDIQGWELPALKGMEKTLAANPNIQLYVELWPYGMAAAGATPKGLFEFLNDFGFSIEFRPKRGMPTAAQFARYSRIKYWFTDLYVRR